MRLIYHYHYHNEKTSRARIGLVPEAKAAVEKEAGVRAAAVTAGAASPLLLPPRFLFTASNALSAALSCCPSALPLHERLLDGHERGRPLSLLPRLVGSDGGQRGEVLSYLLVVPRLVGGGSAHF